MRYSTFNRLDLKIFDMKPLIEIINTDNEPNIIDQILTNKPMQQQINYCDIMAKNVLEMTDRLRDLGILGDIRQRLGAKDEHDSSFDKQIDSMSEDELISEWSAWKLGSSEWWKTMNRMYNRLRGNF